MPDQAGMAEWSSRAWINSYNRLTINCVHCSEKKGAKWGQVLQRKKAGQVMTGEVLSYSVYRRKIINFVDYDDRTTIRGVERL